MCVENMQLLTYKQKQCVLVKERKNCKQIFFSMDGITWEQFLCDIKNIHDISQQLNDTWEIISKVRIV